MIAAAPTPWQRFARFWRVAFLRWELHTNEQYLATLISGGFLTEPELRIWRDHVAACRVRLIQAEAS